VLLDLWDIEKVSPDAPDRAERVARLRSMNLSHTIEERSGHRAT
jgi:hypothetical protein